MRVHAHIDALTGLKNCGALEDGLSRAAAGVARKGGGFAAVRLDVDHFKRVNDTYGHGIGDEVLRRLGATIGVLCRTTDLAAHYGGEFGFTVSAGLAMAGGDCPADDVLQRADEALYHAKGLGRDRLVIWAMAPSDEPGA